MASALNSLAAVTVHDFVHEALGAHLPEHRGAFWAKCISIIYGCISFALVSNSNNTRSLMIHDMIVL